MRPFCHFYLITSSIPVRKSSKHTKSRNLKCKKVNFFSYTKF
ncbi:hypothetical protein M902_0992 [Bacteriovorax sp. BAL6_X]|nr:hypothetical protein M902_0992 [Bacteriovorax sp. BAL6_X]